MSAVVELTVSLLVPDINEASAPRILLAENCSMILTASPEFTSIKNLVLISMSYQN
ncbi:hypothetical protein GPLA_0684 [Paraglaciecola polaris LMG 21857]|uniref:Uncharacterized protein n=1 Tax=Paraglaciecola polaris LMG 21857 TaxID=1129793 RepID=K7A824_9ALTE|nr:hypothetical protein GPLA_0684 [Paraglaciecola polaris LMG 21857]